MRKTTVNALECFCEKVFSFQDIWFNIKIVSNFNSDKYNNKEVMNNLIKKKNENINTN
jgi:hypothetical protein